LIQIGDHSLSNPVVLAPMAGISDTPFRRVCQAHGAGATTAEMVTANWHLWQSQKSSSRLPDSNWPEPRIVQIAGSEPVQMAEAARRCADVGAQIIDINMGCPVKKVCKKAAGSALLQDEPLVANILAAVVKASPVPVTLKIRTGWNKDNRNAPAIALIAQDVGIQALVIHGRTRACLFKGHAEYDTIAEVIDKVAIPVFANGDIASPDQAKAIMDYTGAAGLMIGRGAQGQPWLFRHIGHLLDTGQDLPAPSLSEVFHCIHKHVAEIRIHYPTDVAVKLSRKHVSAYLSRLGCSRKIRKDFNLLDHVDQQDEFLDKLLFDLNLSSLIFSSTNNKNWNLAA
jgi:tRNA-dihydrouridine synthase B